MRESSRTCRVEIDRVHRTEDGQTVLYYFWVASVLCPCCRRCVRLFDSPVFSKNAYPKRKPEAQLVCPECLDIQPGRYDFDSATCSNGHEFARAGSVKRSSATCSAGHEFRVSSALNGYIPTFEVYAKMVLDQQGNKSYAPITDWDRALYVECERLLAALPSGAILPTGRLTPGNNTNQALGWNFYEWRQFFNARQLYSLSLMATAIRDLDESPEREALCALFSGTLEFNNLFTSFKGEGTGAVRHMFSNHVLKPERTPLEAHPWGTRQSSGSFSTLFQSRLVRAYMYKANPIELATSVADDVVRISGLSKPLNTPVRQDWESLVALGGAYLATRNSARTDLPDGSVDLVITDPPFMDNVHYAELADFFHSWLRLMNPYAGYSCDDTTRQVGEVQSADPAEFGRAIEAVWTECQRVLKPGGLLAFTFHQAKIDAWVYVIEALYRAGLVVTAVQPVKGEMTTSVVKSGALEPSNLDSVVVCRRIADGAENPHRSLDEALQYACEKLRLLIDAKVDVGRGDVRSVVRGTLLAHLASTTADLRQKVDVVDDIGTQVIRSLFPGKTSTGSPAA